VPRLVGWLADARHTVTKLRIGVIYGGRSSEHEVSLASAAAVIANLDVARYDVVPIRIERDGRWTIPDQAPTDTVAGSVIASHRQAVPQPDHPETNASLRAEPSTHPLLQIERRGTRDADGTQPALLREWHLDVVFPVLHGPFGEDGTIQGLLELADVPYVGAGVLASAVGMDKAVQKLVFAACRLPIVDHVTVRRSDWRSRPAEVEADIQKRLPFPVFVKPANLGSSVGISKAKDTEHLSAALALAARHDRKILIEAAVPEAREIECAVLGNDTPLASVPGEIVPSREFYDYEAKYLDNGSRLLIPAPLSESIARDVQRLALAAYAAIDCAGLARVDFLIARASDAVFLNEVNTIPGFTTISMYAKLWEASGLPYPQILDRLIALALDRHADRGAIESS
jgi:D-alanine-D-alanine ligase